jgi:ubiquinone biosynthesis monooxygenase Coq7
MSTNTRSYLPGDKPVTKTIQEIIRVDHSGEYGAKKIYAGQIIATKHLQAITKFLHGQKQYDELLKTLQEMHDSEIPHYKYFEDLVSNTKTRPSFLLPLWSLMGFVSGYITGIVGQKTAMTLTVGVEDVIGNHYNTQLQEVKKIIDDKNTQLTNDNLLRNLHDKIKQFMYDELEHLNTGFNWQAQQMCGHFYFNMLVKFATKSAISIAKNI